MDTIRDTIYLPLVEPACESTVTGTEFITAVLIFAVVCVIRVLIYKLLNV